MQFNTYHPDRGPIRGLLLRASSRTLLPYLAATLCTIVALLIAGNALEHHINAIEIWINRLGPWGVFAFIGLFVIATSLLVPDTVLCIIAGALFGVGWGAVAVLFGTLTAGTVQFFLAHYVIRSRIQRFLTGRPTLAAIQRAVIQDEFRLQLLVRLTPVNPAMLSYLLGAAGVRFWRFLLASLATAPSLLVEVYFGHTGKHVIRLAGGATKMAAPQILILIGGLAICIVVLIVISRMARKALREAINKTDMAE